MEQKNKQKTHEYIYEFNRHRNTIRVTAGTTPTIVKKEDFINFIEFLSLFAQSSGFFELGKDERAEYIKDTSLSKGRAECIVFKMLDIAKHIGFLSQIRRGAYTASVTPEEFADTAAKLLEEKFLQ